MKEKELQEMQKEAEDMKEGQKEKMPEREPEEEQQKLLEVLVKNSGKQLRYSRITAIAGMIIAAALVICLIMVLPKTIAAINNANNIMVQASETISLADEAIESVTAMSDSITDMGNNMDTFITENAQAVTAVMEKIEGIDFEGLNGAIKDLGDVVEPLAKFFGKFK